MSAQAKGTMHHSAKGHVVAPARLNDELLSIVDAVAAWPGINATVHWHFVDRSMVDGVDFYLGEDELGHLHLDGSIHLATSAPSGEDAHFRWRRKAVPIPSRMGRRGRPTHRDGGSYRPFQAQLLAAASTSDGVVRQADCDARPGTRIEQSTAQLKRKTALTYGQIRAWFMLVFSGAWAGVILTFEVERTNLWARMPIEQYAVDFRRSLFRVDPMQPILAAIAALAAGMFAWNRAGVAMTLAWVGLGLVVAVVVEAVAIAEPITSKFRKLPEGQVPEDAARLRTFWRRFHAVRMRFRWLPSVSLPRRPSPETRA